jgi:very-short-patch-repair endonuclease
MKVDLLNATLKVAIEVNGKQHSEFNKFFHSNSRVKYLDSIKRDFKKAEWLDKNKFKLIEIEENEIGEMSKTFFKEKFGLIL